MCFFYFLFFLFLNDDNLLKFNSLKVFLIRCDRIARARLANPQAYCTVCMSPSSKINCQKFLRLMQRLPIIKPTLRSGWIANIRRFNSGSRGFLAGLHLRSEDFGSFDEAWDAALSLENKLIEDFENDLWRDQKRRFVFGSKTCSVIDTEEDNGVTRKLVLNERPHLVQSAVKVNKVAGPFDLTSGINLTSLQDTHLGGLALSLGFWKIGNAAPSCPKCVVLGAGGCSIPMTLAQNLPLHETENEIVAVEPNRDVKEAAATWFGAHDGNGKFRTVVGTGSWYLRGLHRHKGRGIIDLLIIDADDGQAPPTEMRSRHFWRELVVPNLAPNAVVAVNIIGNENEGQALRKVVASEATEHSAVLIPAPEEAGCASDRHALLFAIPKPLLDKLPDHYEQAFEGLVDEPLIWSKCFDSLIIN